MKRYLLILFFAMMFVACDKVYINGELDGMWQLQRVERAGEVLAPENIYYTKEEIIEQIEFQEKYFKYEIIM